MSLEIFLDVVLYGFVLLCIRDAVQKKNGKKSDIVTLAFDPSPP